MCGWLVADLTFSTVLRTEPYSFSLTPFLFVWCAGGGTEGRRLHCSSGRTGLQMGQTWRGGPHAKELQRQRSGAECGHITLTWHTGECVCVGCQWLLLAHCTYAYLCVFVSRWRGGPSCCPTAAIKKTLGSVCWAERRARAPPPCWTGTGRRRGKAAGSLRD